MKPRSNKNKRGGPAPVEKWYREYYSQRWYSNSFLANRPTQIGRTTGKTKFWNSIAGCGCNLTCLAMVLGIDPARLASLFIGKGCFRPDRDLRAQMLSGRQGHLVWDQNVPDRRHNPITLLEVWHPVLGRCAAITLRFVRLCTTSSYRDGVLVVASMRRNGHHVVCGPEEHATLVAGRRGGAFFIWDPDPVTDDIESVVAGCTTLEMFFNRHSGTPIDFVEYEVQFEQHVLTTEHR